MALKTELLFSRQYQRLLRWSLFGPGTLLRQRLQSLIVALTLYAMTQVIGYKLALYRDSLSCLFLRQAL